MVTINLSNNPQSSKDFYSASFFDKGVVLSILLLVLVGIGWGGSSLYLDSLEKKKAGIEKGIESYLGGGSTDQLADGVADFSQRMDAVVREFDGDHNPAESLKKIAESLVNGVYVNSAAYDADKKQYILALNGPNFSVLAQQIASFKKSEYFKGNTTIEDSSSNKQGPENPGAGIVVGVSFGK